MEMFVKGDIVRHTLLESEKVVVGIGKDRYLCVHLEDISPDGHVRSNARVAMHQGSHLEKVGHRGDVAEVDLNSLYHKEMMARHGKAAYWLRQEILMNSLFILAVILIVMALFSGSDAARRKIEEEVLKKEEALKAEYRIQLKRELGR